MSLRRWGAFIAPLGIIVGVVMACSSGTDGASGPVGPTGAQGTPGPAGSAGLAAVPGTTGTIDGGLPAGCLSPCHGFGGIVEQWKTSTHYSTFISNLGGEEIGTWTGAQACGNCHAIDGIEQRVAGNVNTAPDAGVKNLSSGETNFRKGASSATESTYGGHAKVAAVNCVTCHSVTPTTDPHLTGKAYTAGDFPLRVPVGANDQAMIEKSADTLGVSGMPAGKLGPSNACVWCHKSRKDVTNYITASNVLSSTHWGPHEGPQTDVFSGAGGYHFTGKTYGQSTHQQKLACVDCHMPGVAGNGGKPNHSFYAQQSACTSCHAGATNFDIAGGQSQIKVSLLELEDALNTAGYLTRGATPANDPLSPAELVDAQFALDLTRNPGAPLTADKAGAVYNYLIVARGSALGVHNPTYVKQLIFDSYVAVTGVAPSTLIRP